MSNEKKPPRATKTRTVKKPAAKKAVAKKPVATKDVKKLADSGSKLTKVETEPEADFKN